MRGRVQCVAKTQKNNSDMTSGAGDAREEFQRSLHKRRKWKLAKLFEAIKKNKHRNIFLSSVFAAYKLKSRFSDTVEDRKRFSRPNTIIQVSNFETRASRLDIEQFSVQKPGKTKNSPKWVVRWTSLSRMCGYSWNWFEFSIRRCLKWPTSSPPSPSCWFCWQVNRLTAYSQLHPNRPFRFLCNFSDVGVVRRILISSTRFPPNASTLPLIEFYRFDFSLYDFNKLIV